jgi:Phage tail assembly chaperone proteins, E, or 41 or 14
MPRIIEAVQLRDPIRHGDEEILSLTLTTPSLGQLIELDQATGDMAKTIATIVVCSGQPRSVISQLMPWDSQRVGAAVARVMGEADGSDGETA